MGNESHGLQGDIQLQPLEEAPVKISVESVTALEEHQREVIEAQIQEPPVAKNPFYKPRYFSLFRYSTKFDAILIVVGTLCALGAGVPLPLIGALFGDLIDNFSSKFSSGAAAMTPEEVGEFRDGVNHKILQLIYVAIGYFVLTYAYTVCWSLIGERLTRQVREHYLRSVLRQNIAYFNQLGSGEVSSRITGDTQIIQNGTSEKVGLCIQSISYFIAAFTVGFVRNATLTGILFCVVPAFLLVASGGSAFSALYASRSMESYSKASTVAEEALANVRIAQAFNSQERLATLYEKNLHIASRHGLRKAIAGALMLGGIFFIAYSANALAFWEGSRLIVKDITKDTGSVYTVIFLVLDSSMVIGQIAPFMQTFSLASGAGEKIFRTIDRVSPIDPLSEEGLKPDACEGRLELRNVKFIYPSRPNAVVLKGVDLVIPAGKTTAIVGVSGSGKSTIVGLVERFYDPVEGEVLLDNRNIKSLNINWLRGQMKLVMQNPTLFNTTIMENISHGLLNSNSAGLKKAKIEELCIEAAKLANAHNFIVKLPRGYNTTVGEGGLLLSGGQKQRIALARAFVSNPTILLMDEATSALDATSERLIQEALEKATKDRTTVVIAHRLSTIKKADNIVVMAEGKILEQGTHSQLMARESAYYHLVEAQSFASESSDQEKLKSTSKKLSAESVDSNMANSEDPLIVKESYHGEEIQLFADNESQGPQPGGRRSQLGVFTLMKRVAKIVKPEWFFVVGGLMSSIIIGGAYSAESILFSHMIDALSLRTDLSQLRSQVNLYSFWFLMVAFIEFTAYSVNGSMFGWVSEKLLLRTRCLSFRSIINQDIAWFDDDRHSTGSLVAMLNTDTNHLGGLTGIVVGTVFSIMTSLFAGIILAHVIAWKIAIVVLAAVPIMLMAGFLRVRVLANFHQRHETAYVKSGALASEAIGAIQTVATLSREEDVCRLYHQSLEGPYKNSMKSIMTGNFWLSLGYSIAYLLYALAYWWGSRLVSNGEFSSKQFFVVLPALLFSAQASGQMFSLAPDLTKAKMAASNIFQLIEQKPTIGQSQDAGKSKGQGDIEGEIELKEIHFRYPSRPDIPVLQGLNLKIKAGQFCALVGESGCGKSTVISLIERRFYDPLQGTVLIDGQDIKKKNVHQHRNNIALVSQEPVLYQGSIRFNVLLGSDRDDITQEEVERVCKQANIHDYIISLPDGYDTMCGTKGGQLSGGQRQRIAIARALIRNPKILLLDEATSALDSQSEKVVQDALNKAATGCTTIAVAHRLSTIQHADRIFVFEGGVVVEEGTHQELMAQRKKYFTLVEHQNLGQA
ncbi:P-loop containing nucleoside triphosphate hydrolase protein [Basidiobolus meristosporus CBS 931.73]|uniref:p-loop containing nucleoside triphosphate hydrolase protein n=1 Tax=Basidiobolus meristosporus CBS 931.73 TaxID=1314790 RepID=A0A1Y1WWW0_9FUNG|nr:P-loop containing nucleoside triphosphate hydrolase protein [Basidiobolus meristosporus CBS 931.73]|eukprot:ORX77993.1 P-loop containing nucleoside triphosphate hydrolase protein [Basidiobolus meristosporus CBS 931.73]